MTREERIKGIEGIIKNCNHDCCMRPDKLATALEASIGVDEDKIIDIIEEEIQKKEDYYGSVCPYICAKAISSNDQIIRIGGKDA